MGHTRGMKILGRVRKMLGRSREAVRPDHLRAVDERQRLDQAKAWQRKGGPVDPGFSA